MPESLNFKMGLVKPYQGEDKGSLVRDSKFLLDPKFGMRRGPITWENFVQWVNAQSFDSFTRKEILKTASHYPTNALHQFVKNINQHLSRIQKKKMEIASEKSQEDNNS